MFVCGLPLFSDLSEEIHTVLLNVTYLCFMKVTLPPLPEFDSSFNGVEGGIGLLINWAKVIVNHVVRPARVPQNEKSQWKEALKFCFQRCTKCCCGHKHLSGLKSYQVPHCKAFSCTLIVNISHSLQQIGPTVLFFSSPFFLCTGWAKLKITNNLKLWN